MLQRALQVLLVISLLSVFVVIAHGLIVYTSAEPAVLEAQDEGVPVSYTLSRSHILLPGECVTFRWAVTKIESVYFNGIGVGGEDSQEICQLPTTSQDYALEVYHRDGNRFIYTLTLYPAIRILWLVVAGTFFLLTTLSYLVWYVVSPRLSDVPITPADATLTPMAVWIAVSLGIALIVATVWFSTDLKVSDIQEHWHIRAFVDTQSLQYDSLAPDNLTELALTRPIARILYWTAYALDPTSFRGDNLVLMFLLWGKGAAFFGVINRLSTRRYVFAFTLAAVFILFPPDLGVISTRIPHIHFSVLAYLIGLNWLLIFWKRRQKRYLIWASISAALAGLAYEAIYPLIFATPVLLLALERRISKRLVRTSLIWCIAPVATFVYSMILIFILNFGFQADIVGEGNLQNILTSLVSLYTTTLFGGWSTAWQTFTEPQEAVAFRISLISATITAMVSFVLLRFQDHETAVPTPLSIGLGLGVILLGFLLYIPTNRLNFDFRVFLISSLGAALIFVSVTHNLTHLLFRRFGKYVYILLMSIAIGLASHYYFIQRSEQSIMGEVVLTQLIEQVPHTRQPVNFIIIPADGSLNYDMDRMTQPTLLTAALHYIYQDRLVNIAVFCDDANDAAQCRESSEGFLVRYPARGDLIEFLYAYESVLIFEIDDNGTIHLLDTYAPASGYAPESLIVPDAPLSPRLTSIFNEMDSRMG